MPKQAMEKMQEMPTDTQINSNNESDGLIKLHSDIPPMTIPMSPSAANPLIFVRQQWDK